jgi:ABC-2 type transport system permease protein
MSFSGKKYFYRIHQSMVRAFEYRTELIGWIILSIIPNLALLLIWQNVYTGHTSLSGYDLSSILQYYLIGTFISGLTNSHFENTRSTEIRQGKIDYNMTRPLLFPTEILLADIGGKIVFNLMAIPGFLFSFWLLSFMFPLGGLSLDLLNISQFITLILFGYALQFFLALIAVLLTFWFEGADGLEHFKMMMVTVLSGAMIPFAFMPGWLLRITNVLPFKYIYSYPISVLQHRIHLDLNDFLYMTITLILLYGMSLIIWKRAVYKYTSAGG